MDNLDFMSDPGLFLIQCANKNKVPLYIERDKNISVDLNSYNNSLNVNVIELSNDNIVNIGNDSLTINEKEIEINELKNQIHHLKSDLNEDEFSREIDEE